MTSIDTILNSVWALLCVMALVCHWWRERQRARLQSRRLRLRRGLSVFLAAFLLFPCISVSDDYAQARLQNFNSIPSSRPVFRNGNSTSMFWAVQLEETEHIRPVAPFVLVLVQCSLMAVLPKESVVHLLVLLGHSWPLPSHPLARSSSKIKF